MKQMKKLLCILLSLLFISSFFIGCVKNDDGSSEQNDSAESRSQINDDFDYGIKDGAVFIKKYTGTAVNVVIPEKIEDLPVKTISMNAFMASNIESVTVPDSVTNIMMEAFQGCKSLKKAMLGNGVVEIGARAFRGCSALEEIKLSENLEKIGKAAFEGCTSLKEIYIPKKVTDMGEGSFFGNIALSKIEFAEGIEKIGQWGTFQGCSALESVTVPKSVTEIAPLTFDSCHSLKFVYFLGDAPDIDYSSFGSNEEIVLLHKKGSKGWDSSELSKQYQLEEY